MRVPFSWFFRLACFLCGCVFLPCHAEDVRIGFGDHLPPFCSADTANGIEVEIFREALASKGHHLVPVFLPIKRVAVAFMSGDIDGAMMDSGFDLASHGGLYGEPAVIYDNVFITLKKRHLAIKRPEDLNGLTVQAFPGALKRYPAWLEPVNAAGRYREQNDQALQVSTLQQGHFDVVLSDRYIFRYYAAIAKRKGANLDSVDEQDFIEPDSKDYRAIFRNKTVLRDYEAGLADLKKSGRYQKIFDQFVRGE
jgi:polar amino acid transport system substrate-binding protein